MAEIFQPHPRSVSRTTDLSQPIAPVDRSPKFPEKSQENALEVALLELAAKHVSESQELQRKLEASIQELEAKHFLVVHYVSEVPEESSSERVKAVEPEEPEKQNVPQGGGTRPRMSSADSNKQSTRLNALTRLLQGVPVEHQTSTEAPPKSSVTSSSKRSQRTPETLRLKRRLKKMISADHYGSLPEDARSWYQSFSLLALVTHPIFDAWTAMVILVNAATIGAETQYGAMGSDLPSSLETVSQVCSFYFLLELLLRIGAHKANWFADPDMRLWNLFDLLLVVMSLIDFMVFRLLQNGAGFTEVKLLKTLRIMRVFRVFRFFRQLTQLALMITDSIRSLIWALVLLAIIIYAFAIFLTANVSDWLHVELGSPGTDWPSVAADHPDLDIRILESAYGSLPQTVYTLVQAVLGGRSWHEVCTPLFKVGWLPVMLLFIYVSFVILAVLNVVTGVFVDNAFRCAEKQRSLAIQKEMDKKEQWVQEIKDFFSAMDQDGSGDVTPDELGEMLDDPALSAYFRVLGFDIDDARRFIQLLDTDSNERISIDEFLRGCLRYRGLATGVDMHTCLRMVRRTEKAINDLRAAVGKTRSIQVNSI